ncbi:MAG TPA: hypothetical protein PKI20_15390 [Verrucomicrobiota bacterium]|jgi:hypothetical protein|nr:hypothetical protein [Verrucomicrobiota bacterium]HQL79139.1 hypothetical protein [Verrucomicrobiota bacterium]
MKVLRKKLRLVFLPAMLFLVLLPAERASAYYDPGVQRWINRDPIDDIAMRAALFQRQVAVLGRGHKALDVRNNTFCYAGNDPADRVDPCGLYDYDDDDNYITQGGKLYNKRCIANAKANAFRCLKDVGKSGGINIAICVVGCLPTLALTPAAYGICVTACLGLDTAGTLVGLGQCLDEYNSAFKLCEVCQPKSRKAPK